MRNLNWVLLIAMAMFAASANAETPEDHSIFDLRCDRIVVFDEAQKRMLISVACVIVDDGNAVPLISATGPLGPGLEETGLAPTARRRLSGAETTPKK